MAFSRKHLGRRMGRVAAIGAVLAAAAVAPLASAGQASASSWIVTDARINALLDIPFQITVNPTTDVHVLGFNDFHGHLETTTPGNLYGAPAGGSVFTAGRLRVKQAAYAGKVATVHAGDSIGATPLVSGGFLDEPSVLSLRRMNLDFAAVGNHEFDKGKAELVRHQTGGCHPTLGCQYGTGNTTYPDGSAVYPGALGPSTAGLKPFKFLSDNVIDTGTGQPLFNNTIADRTMTFPATSGGTVKVGFIGETLEATPTIVTPTGVAGLSFQDEADAANALVPQFQAAGVNALVLVVHEGGFQNPAPGAVNGCAGALIDPASGQPYAVLDIARRLDPAIKVVVSGHTHAEYNCEVERDGVADSDPSDNVLITGASSFGRAISDITLRIDDTTGQVVAVSSTNERVDRTGTGDNDANPATFDQNSIVSQYSSAIAPVANRVIGEISGAMPNTGVPLPGTGGAGLPSAIPAEQPAGNFIADAQLASTQAAPNSAVIALMNPGGVRNPGLTFPSSAAGEGDSKVTYGEAFTVQPFGNSLVTMTLTGQQLDQLLEQQFQGCRGQATTRILQPSASFSYAVLADPDGDGVVGGDADDCDRRVYDLRINGAAVNPTDSIRVTVNNFLSTGGDGFRVLLGGTNLIGGAQDIDALEAYLAPSLGTGPDFAPPATTRIRLHTGAPDPVVPEAPWVVLLPVSGAVLVGAAYMITRRFRLAS